MAKQMGIEVVNQFSQLRPVTGTKVGKKQAIDTFSLGGTITTVPGGLGLGFLITTVEVTSTPTKFPTTAFPNRGAIALFNTRSGAGEIIYFGPTAGVTPDTVAGTTSGWEIAPSSTEEANAAATLDYFFVKSGAGIFLMKIYELA